MLVRGTGIDDLFSSEGFTYSDGPFAPLNAGMFVLKPSLATFDAWTSGFEDVPERADARASLAGTLGNLAAAARAANAAAWVEALEPVSATARDHLEAEPTCFTDVAGNGLASLAACSARARQPARR